MRDREPEIDRSESPDAYVHAIMRREIEAAERKVVPPRRRSQVPLLVASMLLFVALTAWNLLRLTRELEVFSPAEEEAALKLTIYLTAQTIEAFHDSTGELPASLAIIGLEDDDVEFSLTGDDGYILTATAGTTRVTYRSGQDLTPFAAGYDELERASEP